jgi:hypothetical protein
MRKHYNTVRCCLLIYVFAASVVNAAGTSELYCSFRSIGFYPDYYSEELPVSQIRYDKFTDIIYFSVYPNEFGSLMLDKVNRKDPNTMRDLVQLAYENNVRISICVGGSSGSEHFGTVVADPAKRSILIDQLMLFTLSNGFDGINLDWEPIDDPDNYALFISELKTEMVPHSLELSVDVILRDNGLRSEVFHLIDGLYIMAYHLHEDAPHSTYEEALAGLAHWDGLGFPRSKTILGLPFFGKDTVYGGNDYFPYKEIVSLYHPAPDVDDLRPSEDINFNGINTIKDKTQYVLENGYGGVMFWDITNDTTDETSLLTAVAEAVQVYGPPDFNCDNVIDILDLSHLMTYWLIDGCDIENTWCDRCDLDLSTEVDISDFAHFSQDWKPLQGDINKDTHVDLSDVVLLVEQWLWSGDPGEIPEDISIDGDVDLRDFAIIAENWLIR